jgi:tetratricopeptide (TPR) repeat protein
VKAYERRTSISPEAVYEHLWRLINIHEALVVCLASLMATRSLHLMRDDTQRDVANALRNAVTGRHGAWQGSIDNWISLLGRFGMFSAIDDPFLSQIEDDPFLASLSNYLSSTPDAPLAFVDAWSRIANVPRPFREPGLNRANRFFAINSFRNKLAHVPIPAELVGDLYEGLAREIQANLCEKMDCAVGRLPPPFWKPLTGFFLHGRTRVTGHSEVEPDQAEPGPQTEVHARFTQGGESITWPVEPFVSMTVEAKVALLFRVLGLEEDPGSQGYGAEYHRFAAELEPVKVKTIATEVMSLWRPQVRTTVVAPAVPSIDPPAIELRRLADEAFGRRDYTNAAKLYAALASKSDRTRYNDVASLKHGAALWRAAQGTSSTHDFKRHVRTALPLLRSAERHRDRKYGARAAHEESLATWHMWRLSREPRYLLKALAAAERAVARAPDEVLVSWHARIKADVDAILPQGLPPNKPLHDSIAHERAGRYSDAVNAAREGIRVNPTDVGAWQSLAKNLMQLGRHDEAREAWKTADELVSKDLIDYDANFQKALADVRLKWASIVTWERFGWVSWMARKGREAISEARAVLRQHPHAHCHLVPLISCLVNEFPDDAGELVGDMLKLDPENAVYMHYRGLAKRYAGRNDLAVTDFEKACKLDPQRAHFWQALGRCLEDLGRQSEAKAAFRIASARDSAHNKSKSALRRISDTGTAK